VYQVLNKLKPSAPYGSANLASASAMKSVDDTVKQTIQLAKAVKLADDRLKAEKALTEIRTVQAQTAQQQLAYVTTRMTAAAGLAQAGMEYATRRDEQILDMVEHMHNGDATNVLAREIYEAHPVPPKDGDGNLAAVVHPSRFGPIIGSHPLPFTKPVAVLGRGRGQPHTNQSDTESYADAVVGRVNSAHNVVESPQPIATMG
jgi:hypothetical protein